MLLLFDLKVGIKTVVVYLSQLLKIDYRKENCCALFLCCAHFISPYTNYFVIWDDLTRTWPVTNEAYSTHAVIFHQLHFKNRLDSIAKLVMLHNWSFFVTASRISRAEWISQFWWFDRSLDIVHSFIHNTLTTSGVDCIAQILLFLNTSCAQHTIVVC